MKYRFSLLFVLCTFVLFNGCAKKPDSVIKNFLEAKTWDEKKTFILDTVNISYDKYDVFTECKVEYIKQFKKISADSIVYKVTYEDKWGTGNTGKFLVVKHNGLEKVDLVSSLHINDMTLIQYLNVNKSTPHKLWFYCSLDNSTTQFFVSEGFRYNAITAKLPDGHCNILIPMNGATIDEKKIFELLMKKDNQFLQLEFTGFYTFYSESYVLTNVKLIQTDPLEEEL